MLYLERFLEDRFWTSWSSVKTGCEGLYIRVAPIDLNLNIFGMSEGSEIKSDDALGYHWASVIVGHDMFRPNHHIVSSLHDFAFW